MTDAITMYDYAITLASIRSIAPEAHIAGGAVRDTILKKPIHDPRHRYIHGRR
jgi:tRNA nucleotidyltransferase/poly(A) polymerase